MVGIEFKLNPMTFVWDTQMTDTVEMFGQTQDVILTESGHYAIPLNNANKIITKIENGHDVKINLISESVDNGKQMAKKLHAQFGHPTEIKHKKF